MVKRIKATDSDETEVLIKSRRRCALCFGLENDFQEKNGQIAHVDKNRSNSNFINLVFLCFNHHDRYDSSTSQSKGITKKELLEYREGLYEHISRWAKEGWTDASSVECLEDLTDKFNLYVESNKDSFLGCPFVARNLARNHAVFISNNLFAIDCCYPSLSEDIDDDYRDTGISFYLPINEIKSLIKDQLNNDKFYINYYISENEVARIEFGVNHLNHDTAKIYFFNKNLNLITDYEYDMEFYSLGKNSMTQIFKLLGDTPLEFIKKININGSFY